MPQRSEQQTTSKQRNEWINKSLNNKKTKALNKMFGYYTETKKLYYTDTIQKENLY